LTSTESRSSFADICFVSAVKLAEVRKKGASLNDFAVPSGLKDFSEQNLEIGI
jgi:hypothetical protein